MTPEERAERERVLLARLAMPTATCFACIGHIHSHGLPGRVYVSSPLPKGIHAREDGRVSIDFLR